jgi:hypothetical protein
MSFQRNSDQYVTATTDEGLLIIHGSPATLTWVPRDALNGAYNVGGIVVVGTFNSVDEARRAAGELYSTPIEGWQISNILPFDMADEARIENHTPEIDGHRLIRHDIHWK